MKLRWAILTTLLVTGGLTACQGRAVKVSSIGQPDYPIRARVDRIQGKALVSVQIDAHGTVVSAKGSGASSVLVKAAEENARKWRFGPFPASYRFPIYRQIVYVFRLEGRPVPVVTEPCDIKTKLPGWIEISAPPVAPDAIISGRKSEH